ncbi:MAG: aspartyl protease family protein [Gemmataceae bacterium]|nr:aspartyl protease family protein [Gemmataceae bacterium]
MPSRTRLTAFSLAAALTATYWISTRPAAGPPPGAPAGEAVVERFTLAKGGLLLLVPVELKGKTYPFALDTGCSGCVYDSSLAPLLGEPVSTQEVRTADGIVRMPLYPPPDAKLGGMSLKTGSPVVTSDLRRLREGLGEEVYGCVGMDFLSRHVFRVDPDREEVVFLRSPGPAAGDRLPVTIKGNVPFVSVKIAGLAGPELFLVDTGAASGGGTGLLRAEAFDVLVKQDKVKPIDTALAVSLSGPSVRWRGRLAEMELAGHRHAGVIFTASGRNYLGLNYWSRYVATFDLAGGAIYLKKGSRYDQADTHDLSGLTVVRLAGRTTVVDVEAGSPAALAGVRPRDVIVKASGERVEGLPLAPVRRSLAVRGAKVSLTLERDGGEREVSFKLPD